MTVTSVAASLLTPPTDMETLKDFYCRIRPAGWWGPVKRAILAEKHDLPRDAFALDMLTAIIGAVGLQCLFLSSTYACTHQWNAFAWALAIVAGCAIALYFTWYKKLPDENEGVALEAVESE